MKKVKNHKISIDDLCYEEDVEEIGFTDYVPPQKNCVALFSFANDEDLNKNNSKENISTNEMDIFDNRILLVANGAVPIISGEKPTLKRCYTLRPTTIKKLNELVAIDVNPRTCLSTIVDVAIEFYYDFIKNEKLNN